MSPKYLLTVLTKHHRGAASPAHGSYTWGTSWDLPGLTPRSTINVSFTSLTGTERRGVHFLSQAPGVVINVVCPDQQALHARRVWEWFQPSPHQGCGPKGSFLQCPVQMHYDTSRARGAASQLPYQSPRISKHLSRPLQSSRKENRAGCPSVESRPKC